MGYVDSTMENQADRFDQIAHQTAADYNNEQDANVSLYHQNRNRQKREHAKELEREEQEHIERINKRQKKVMKCLACRQDVVYHGKDSICETCEQPILVAPKPSVFLPPRRSGRGQI